MDIIKKVAIPIAFSIPLKSLSVVLYFSMLISPKTSSLCFSVFILAIVMLSIIPIADKRIPTVRRSTTEDLNIEG